jgi:uncharacterized protein YggE
MKFAIHVIVVIFLLLSFTFVGIAGNETNLPLHIDVTGNAKIKFPVDHINIYIHIEIKDPKNQLQTKLKSDKVVRKILAVAKIFEIKDKDIDASYAVIGPDEIFDPKKEDYVKAGYISERSVNLTLRNIDKLDELLTKIIEIDSTEILELCFSSDKYDDKAAEKLLALAVIDAKRQATILSKALTLKLGKILAVSIDDDNTEETVFGDTEENDEKTKTLDNSFLKKTVSFDKSINITYELKE